MRIEDEIKLTFDDVLIRPKRSTLISRSEVHLERSFKFKHTESVWNGVPIVSQQLLASSLNPTPTNQTFGQQQQSQLLDPHHQARQAGLLLQLQNSHDPHSINQQPSGIAARVSTRREESDVDERQSVSEKKQA